ncbi:uncharacterized protein LY89DRAFT_590949 [Mollisia scopiformis]|uniref:Aminoglycoside phosphotransferase domain-containing protein n=1 Tax=Mollisia scopiformis TaxID=149040 RepID=A0A194X191_MOLSC|nr:uncharacterized protein LY89DRAFT_590949 [Mollisia scopiformis]KUJ13960.1 hypothetical protein LY89DRAFT_590949 [Mollisia scopiformis]
MGNDYITLKFLRDQGSKLPLPGEVLLISGPDEKVRFTLTKKVPGQWLGSVWHTLSLRSRRNVSRQMTGIVKALRRFTRPTAQKADGTPLEDFLVGRCLFRSPSCTQIGSTTEEWLDALAPTLRGGLSNIHKTNDPVVIEEKLAELRANFPSGGPYYLTHGDLNFSNILVEGDKITAILDWEWSGFMPWWAERLTAGGHNFPADEFLSRIWANVEPELDEETFISTVAVPVGKVKEAWDACKVDHPNFKDRWVLPAFSECQSAAGHINWFDCGNQVEHKINPNQWDDEGQK